MAARRDRAEQERDSGHRPKDPRRLSNYVALAGEFFVLAELALRGLDGTLTLGHTKEIDVLVLNRQTKKTFRVEVKTTGKGIERGRLFGENYAWLMHRRHQELRDDDLVYVFVYLETSPTRRPPPRFFVVPAADVATYIRWNHAYWLQQTPGHRDPDSALRVFRIPAGHDDAKRLPASWRDGRWRQWEKNWAVFGPTAGS
jgi:hypothetical protein